MAETHPPGERQAWRLFDQACRLAPPRSDEGLARALSAQLGEPVTPEQVRGGRQGTLPISADLLLAAYQVAGIEQRLVVGAGPHASPAPAPVSLGSRRRAPWAPPKLRVIEGGLAALIAATLLLLGAFSPRVALVLTDGRLRLPYVSQPAAPAAAPTPLSRVTPVAATPGATPSAAATPSPVTAPVTEESPPPSPEPTAVPVDATPEPTATPAVEEPTPAPVTPVPTPSGLPDLTTTAPSS